MPSVEALLVAALLAADSVTDLIDDRLAPRGGLADGAAPAVDYQRISVPQTSCHLTGGGSLDQVRVQVTSWAMSAQAARELADIVRDVIAPADDVGIATLQGSVGPVFDQDTKQWGAVDDYFIWQRRN